MNVGPGSRSHSSFSSARRYFARIFVRASISETSRWARMRASRSMAPMSGISRLGYSVSSTARTGTGSRGSGPLRAGGR